VTRLLLKPAQKIQAIVQARSRFFQEPVLLPVLDGALKFSRRRAVFGLCLGKVALVPRLLGAAVDLPPLVVMTGAVVGVSVGGILGMMLGTPVIATGREILGYIYRKLLDQEPFPMKETVTESGTSSSPSKSWFFSRLAEIQKRIRSRLPESRQGNGETSHPQNISGQ